MGRHVSMKFAAALAVTAALVVSTVGTAAAAGVAAAPAPSAAADANRGGGGGERITPNSQLPAPIQVDERVYKLVATQRGAGQQVYNCVNGAYTLREPVAVLSALRGGPVGIHGQGPFWASSVDGSRVNGSAPVSVPSPAGPSNIAWLKVTGSPLGPDGVFSKVAFIQRTDTRGGAAPTSCSGSGSLAVDYSTIYQFWAKK